MKNKEGVTLVEIMVALGLTGVIGLLAFYPMLRVAELQLGSDMHSWLETYHWELMSALTNEDSWNLIKTNNAAELACIIDNTDCTAKKATRDSNRLKIYSTGNNIPINDSSVLTSGFTYGGKPCNEFTYNGNDKCPFRVVVVWEPLCINGACLSPDIRFYVSFKYAPGSNRGKKGNLDMNRYSFKLVRSGSALSVEGIDGTCESMGGQFYPNGNGGMTCILDNPADLCSDVGEVPVGFDANNDVICQQLVFNYSCPADEYFMGVDNAGNPQCGKCP